MSKTFFIKAQLHGQRLCCKGRSGQCAIDLSDVWHNHRCLGQRRAILDRLQGRFRVIIASIIGQVDLKIETAVGCGQFNGKTTLDEDLALS